MFQVKAQTGPLIELEVALDQVRLEQGHAAADIPADEVRIDHSLGHKGRADRAAFPRVQIREADRQADSLKLCRGIELAERLAFDPAPGRGEKAHIGFSQCVHAFLSCPAARDWGFSGRVGSVRNSAFRTLHSAFKWSPRLVSRQRLLLFREALICLSYSG